jgi:hypothetical protein
MPMNDNSHGLPTVRRARTGHQDQMRFDQQKQIPAANICTTAAKKKRRGKRVRPTRTKTTCIE